MIPESTESLLIGYLIESMTHLVHQGKMLNDKNTIEEHNIGAEATIEMSLRTLGGMEKWNGGLARVRRKRKRKGSWRKCVKVNRRDQVVTRCSYEGK